MNALPPRLPLEAYEMSSASEMLAKRRAAIAEFVRKHNDIRGAAEKWGTTVTYVKRICDDLGVEYTFMTRGQERELEIKNGIEAGRDIEDLAKELGISVPYARRLAARVGFDLSDNTALGRGKVASTTLEIIAELIRRKSLNEIAQQFNLAKQRISQIKEAATAAGIFTAVAEIKGSKWRPSAQEDTSERRKKIAEHVTQHRDPKGAAKEFGVSLSAVYHACTAEGVMVIDDRHLSRREVLEVLGDLLRGDDPAKIARRRKVKKRAIEALRANAEAAGVFEK